MPDISSRALTRLSAVVPEALKPAWLHDTWTGSHGTLSTVIERTNGAVWVTNGMLTGNGRVIGNVLHDADHAGRFVRKVTLYPQGRLNADHEYLVLGKDHQGTGFARSFNEQAFARYAQAGVDDVSIYAALSVGGYAWARQGFEIAAEGADDLERALARGRGISDLVHRAFDEGSLHADQLAALEPRLVVGDRLPPDALTSIGELAAIPEIGKTVLLGRSWYGIKPIERTAAWWEGHVPPAIADAARGASYLHQPDSVRSASRAAATAFTDAIPEPLRADAVSSAIARHIGDLGTDTAARTINTEVVFQHGAPPEARTTVRLWGDSGKLIKADISTGIDGNLMATSRNVAAPDQLAHSFNRALEDLGARVINVQP
jgi:hypothetical protein